MVDSIETQHADGLDVKDPRWADLSHYKYAARQGVHDSSRSGLQVGRTGALTPVAHLTSRSVGGVTGLAPPHTQTRTKSPG